LRERCGVLGVHLTKKEMKKLLSVLGILALCLTFASCDKDEDEGNKLLGVWKLAVVGVDDEDYDYGDVGMETWLVFNATSAAMYYLNEDEGWYTKTEAPYQFDGKTVTIEGDDAEIVKLTSSELVLRSVDEWGEQELTFKKVKALPDLEDYEEIAFEEYVEE
jgi:hypothetical protein